MMSEAVGLLRPAELRREPFVVVNPQSGGGRTGRRWARLESELREAFGPVEVGFTDGPMHGAALARQALLDGFQTVVAVGGDGTLNEVLNGFFDPDGTPVSPDAALAVLPQGTGGDFRRSVDVPLDWSRAVRHVAAAPVRRVDVGRVRYRTASGDPAVRFFLNVASCGVSGAVADEVNRTSKWMGGRIAFMWATAKTLWGYRDQLVRLSVDDGPSEQVPVTALACGNGRFFGSGMMVAPDAKLDDGILHCTLWGGYGLGEFIFKAPGLYTGAHARWPKTRCFEARRVTVDSDERVLLDIDGEQPGMLPATFDLLPGALALKA